MHCGQGGYGGYGGHGGHGGHGGQGGYGGHGGHGGGGNYRGGRGGYPRGPVGELEANANPKLKESMKDNFDFSAHHLGDQPAQVIGTDAQPSDIVTVADVAGIAAASDDQKAKYNKGMDFFDCISNST